MNYQDDFSAAFPEKEGFLEFLDGIEERGCWRVFPTNEIQVFSLAESPELCREIEAEREGADILQDTRANTGLLLKVGEEHYPLGATAIKTLENRARISGYALQDLGRGKLARVLNDCLEVTKGNALVRIHEGKARAVHGGDKSDYAVLPMPELFEASAIHMEEQYERVRFLSGYFDHWLVTAFWEIQDRRLLDTYRDMLLQYGQVADPELSAQIKVHSSDVGVSGANIFYSLLMGKERRPLVLGDALRLEHSGGASLADFSRNLSQVFARYREAVEGLSGLFSEYLTYPANVIARVMKKAGIGVGLTAKTAELFKAGHGFGGCNGYEVYCGICECIFLAQSEGAGVRALTDLEEKVSRCLAFPFKEYDIPGEVRY